MEQSKLSLQKCFIIFTLVGLIFGCFAAEERNFIEKIRAMPKRYVTSLPERTTTERFAIIHREIGLRPLYNAVVGSGITLFVFTSLAILIPMRNYRIVLAILLVVITAVIRQFSPFFIFELLRWVAYWKGNDVDLDTTILRTPFIWLKEVRIPVSDGYDVTMVRFASLPERFVEAFLQVGLLFAVILLFRKLNLARIAEPKPIESPANT